MSRGEISEVHESPEKQVTKTPEKRINTYDDLGTSDSAGNIETYDGLRRSTNEKSINTYDDLRAPKDGADKTNATKASDSPKTDTPEMVEQRRIDQAAEGIRSQEKMNPEKWKTLKNDGKRNALEHVGKELGKAYETPEPPLTTKKMEDSSIQGSYGDGYKYDPNKDKYHGQIEQNPDDFEGHGIVGSDYGVRMNEAGFDPEKNKKLFGEDPRQAVETYVHEFRHSYQQEQAQRFEKGFKVDDPEKAKEWTENFESGNYKYPPNEELAQTDPERYNKEFDEYRNQPVERDARDFADKVTSNIYTKEEEKAGIS